VSHVEMTKWVSSTYFSPPDIDSPKMNRFGLAHQLKTGWNLELDWQEVGLAS